MPGIIVKDLPISRNLVDVYLINHPNGEGIEDWAQCLYKGIRWIKLGRFFYRHCVKHIRKARKELNFTTIFILLEGAAAIYKLRKQGWGEKEAFERVKNLIVPGNDPDNLGNEIWLWYKEHERQEEKGVTEGEEALFKSILEATGKASKEDLWRKGNAGASHSNDS